MTQVLTDYFLVVVVTAVRKYAETPFARVWETYMAQRGLRAEGQLPASSEPMSLLETYRYVQKVGGYRGLFQSAGFKTLCALSEPYIHWAAMTAVLTVTGEPQTQTQLLCIRLAVTVAGTAATYPLIFLRYRMLVDSSAPTAKEITQKTYAQEGLRGFYRGSMSLLCSIVAYRSIYYGCTSLTRTLASPNQPLALFLVQYTNTLVAGIVTWPIDVVRRRAFLRVGNPQRPGGNAFVIGREIYANEGPVALWEKCGMNLLRGIIRAFGSVLWDTVVSGGEEDMPTIYDTESEAAAAT